MISVADIAALSPLVALALAAVAAMLTAGFAPRPRAVAIAAVAGLLVALATLPLAAARAPALVGPLIRIDAFALALTALCIAATLALTLIADAYLDAGGDEPRAPAGELHVLMLIATLGAAVLVSSRHFVSMFLGLELVSVSLFGALAYLRGQPAGLDAGIKYLILSGVSSSMLLLGMALMYAEVGALDFASMRGALAEPALGSFYVTAGLASITAGVAFKLSLVPFHMWTPDVYRGAPAPVAGFLSTVAKGAVFAAVLRLFTAIEVQSHGPTLVAVTALAVASMLLGNVLAVRERNVKRILAYSSIAHVGYLAVVLLAAGQPAIEAATYYLAAYFVMTVGAFGIVSALSSAGAASDIETLDAYRGLFWRRPWLAAAFMLMLLSLAGIPLTMGFVAKLYVLAAGVESARWLLVASIVAGSIIGLFYYLRIIVAMLLSPRRTGATRVEKRALPAGAVAALAALTVALIVLGAYPEPLLALLGAVDL